MRSRRHFIVGDVHGMLDELAALVEELDPSPRDVFVFVGDLVDKGPQSAAVVKYVRRLSKYCKVVLVEGNHEEKHRRFRRSRNMELKGSEEIASITAQLSPEDVSFLNKAVPFYRIPKYDVLVVHAGIPGDFLDFPKKVEEVYSFSSKQQRRFSSVMRTRYVDARTGKMKSLGKNTPADPFWAEVYDGRFGHVVFGHEPWDDVAFFPHATGIDTAAVYGGALTALVYSDEAEPFVVSVEALRAFAQRRGDDD